MLLVVPVIGLEGQTTRAQGLVLLLATSALIIGGNGGERLATAGQARDSICSDDMSMCSQNVVI